MSYYSIKEISTGEVWSGVVVENATAALALVRFGKLIGKPLTLERGDGEPDFLLAEHDDSGPHWVDFRIPVYRASA